MTILNITENLNFSKKAFALTGLAVAISMAGCSSDNPDAGSGSLSSTAISGTAVDGYVAGATVYIDYNNDGRKSAGEPSALTDKDGYFSTAKDGVTNYCASDATALQKVHCLKAAEVGTDFVIRTFGGFDLYTGEPFLGSLARRVTPENDGTVANQMISPLTSMLVDVSDADDQQTLLDFFGLAADDLDADFLDSEGYDANTLNTAIKLHKVVTLFSEAFSEHYEEFGQERTFPETPNAIVYKALAASLADRNVLDSTTFTNAFNAAQTEIRALYDADEDLFAPGISLAAVGYVQNALDMIGLVDDAIPSDTSFGQAKSRVIGVETVLKKMIDGDTDVAQAITEAGNTGSALYTAIDAALSGGDIDFTALTEVDYSSPEYSNVAIVGGDSFANLANKQLYIGLSDDGQTGDAYLFFNSEEGASGGELKLCIRYNDGQFEQKFEESDGVLFSGTWLSLDDSKLVLKLAGSLSLSLTDKGMQNTQHRYTLSYGGDTLSWLSASGLLDELESQGTVEQPTDDASCQALLETNDNNQA